MHDPSDLNEELSAAGWRTFDDAFGEQAARARELIGEDHRAHRSGELVSPTLAELTLRLLRFEAAAKKLCQTLARDMVSIAQGGQEG